MLGVGAVLPCSSSSSSELNPAIRSEVSFSVGSCLLPHPDKLDILFVLINGFVERKQFSADISSKLGSSFSIVPFVIVVSVCTILTMIATLPVAQLFFFHILFVEKFMMRVMMKETFSSLFVNKKQLYQTPVTRDGPSLKVQLCVLKGDFESEDWTIEEFNSNIESPRERKGSLLKGDTAIIFKNVSYCKGSSGVDSQWCSSMNTLNSEIVLKIMDDSTSDYQVNQSEVNFEFESNEVPETFGCRSGIFECILEKFGPSMVLMSSLFSTYKHFSHTSLYKSSPLFIVLNPIKWLMCG
ncbi:hypothetical protein Ahy_B06g085100 [Arachis hypogaea]|uniref:Calmodulin binding protein-like N-terminal domain-containing protein n=1 Tax=Arachis hypogaea TaxID=3818 RepID=A0A444YTG9_ARAHY|nr:hypothetical protein Ahy_B06g085100 [Arachis hypogaea]